MSNDRRVTKESSRISEEDASSVLADIQGQVDILNEKTEALSHFSELLAGGDMDAIVKEIGTRRMPSGKTLLQELGRPISSIILPAIVAHLVPEATDIKFVSCYSYETKCDRSYAEFSFMGLGACLDVNNRFRIYPPKEASGICTSRIAASDLHIFKYGMPEYRIDEVETMRQSGELAKAEEAWMLLREKDIIDSQYSYIGRSKQDAVDFATIGQPVRFQNSIGNGKNIFGMISRKAVAMISARMIDDDPVAHILERAYFPIRNLDNFVAEVENATRTVMEWEVACRKLSAFVPEGFTLDWAYPDDPEGISFEDRFFADKKIAEQYGKAYALLDEARGYRFVQEGRGLSYREPMFPNLVKRYSA